LIQLLPLGWSEGQQKYGKIRTIPRNRGRAKSGLFRPSRPLTERLRKLVSHRMLETPNVKYNPLGAESRHVKSARNRSNILLTLNPVSE